MRQTKHNGGPGGGGGQSKMKRAQSTKIEPTTNSIKNSDNLNKNDAKFKNQKGERKKLWKRIIMKCHEQTSVGSNSFCNGSFGSYFLSDPYC